MSNNELTNKVYKARKNILEQLKSIGYKIDDYSNFSLNDIATLVENENPDMLLENKDSKVYVKFYIFKNNLRLNVINDMISDLYVLEEILNENDTLIIITKDMPNLSIKEIQSELFVNENKFINVRGIDSLQFNILEHKLVPEHIKLNDEEIVSFKKEFSINSNEQLPTISRFDPPVMAINVKPGDIVKIKRSCKTSIKSDYYRLCVNT